MKVGDRVKIVCSPYEGEALSVGKEGTIMRSSYDNLLDVVLDSQHVGSEGDPFWPFLESALEVI